MCQRFTFKFLLISVLYSHYGHIVSNLYILPRYIVFEKNYQLQKKKKKINDNDPENVIY